MSGKQLHDYADEEILYNRFMEPALREALNFLHFPHTDGTVLDAGCGPGGLFPGLAQVDLEATLPYPAGCFDGVWSADVITPDDFADIPRLVAELFRVLKPGGFLALFYGNWLRQQLLPGHSRLEHLISIAKECSYARDRAWGGHNHPECAERWLREAGCESTVVRLLPVSYHQPLPPHVHRFLADRSLGTFYDKAIQEFGGRVGLDASDLALWRSLSDPQSPDFILNEPEYGCVQLAMLAVGYKPSHTARHRFRRS